MKTKDELKKELETVTAEIFDMEETLKSASELLRLRKEHRENLVVRLIDPKVSDHAIVRYIERFYKIDVESLRDEILTEERKNMIISGATAITCNGVKFAVRNNVITTVLV
jgi:hypothetical protein